MRDQYYHNHDRAYPNQSKYVEEPGRMGAEEIIPSRLTGEVELIARSSYRLGAAEATANIAMRDARDASQKADETKDRLERVSNERDRYERYSEQYSGELQELRSTVETKDAEIAKLKDKLKPKKKVVKKTKKVEKK